MWHELYDIFCAVQRQRGRSRAGRHWRRRARSAREPTSRTRGPTANGVDRMRGSTGRPRPSRADQADDRQGRRHRSRRRSQPRPRLRPGRGQPTTLASRRSSPAAACRSTTAAPGSCPAWSGCTRPRSSRFLAEIISAAGGRRIGLVNRVVPAAELDAFVDDWARRLAAGPPIALSMTKRMLNDSLAVLDGPRPSRTRPAPRR